MRKLKLFSRVPILAFLLVFLTTVFGVGNAWGAASADVTYDFTTSGWTVSSGTLSNGTVSFTGAGGANFKMNTGYFMMGKSGAYINFPTYSKAVEKIVVTGNSGGSASTVMNIFVGETAVSTATTGSTGTNTYNIASASQAAGTTYTLKVTSNHNAQITKIEIFYAAASGCEKNVTISKGTPSNGDFTLSKTGAQPTCDAAVSVVVTPAPADHYKATGVTAPNSSNISAPDEDGKYTVTYAQNTNAASEINVTFALKDQHTVTWDNNGVTSTSQVYDGEKPIFPTPAPTSCDASSTTFIGWATGAWAGKVPSVTAETVYTSADAMPAVTAAVTYYAVFAKVEGSGAAVGEKLWAEDFSGFAANDVPNESNAQTTVYGSGSVTYSVEDGGGTTKIYTGSMSAGGVEPELLVAKSNGSFTASGIPVAGAHTATLTYHTNQNLSVTTTTSKVTIGDKTVDAGDAKLYTRTITFGDGVASTFDLTFKMTGSSNSRLDDIVLTVATNSSSISDYMTTCAAAGQCAAPTFSVAGGTYNAAQSVELSCETDDATIHYTTNGDAPTSSSATYSSAIAVNENMTIKAIAVKDGSTDSEVAEAVYVLKPATPTISGTDNFLESSTITLACETDGAAIYYTTNGDAPTSSSELYSAPFDIDATTTVKAIAIIANWTNSEVATQEFKKVPTYTVAEALAVIDALADNASTDSVCVRGVIKEITEVNTGYKNATYLIQDGGVENELTVFRGKYINKADFTDENKDNLQLGDEVLVKGKLKKYVKNEVTTPEIDQNNYIVTYHTKTLADVQVDGAVTKTEYNKGEAFAFNGLQAHAIYDTYYMEDIPFDEVEWTADPATITKDTVVEVGASWHSVSCGYIAPVAVTLKKYAVTISTPENGSIVVKNNGVAIESGDEVKDGTVLTVETTADDYYRLATLTANEADIKSAGQFEVGAAAVVVAATFEAQPVQLLGDLGDAGWGDGILFSETANPEVRTLTLTDLAVGTYSFKLKVNGEWRSNAATFERSYQGANDISGNESNNMTLVVDKAGDYTLTWGFSNESLGFTFPTRDYTLVGVSALTGGYNWGDGLNVEANLLTNVEGGFYRIVKEDLLLAVGSYEYQIARDHDWRGVSNSILSIATSGRYNVTFTFNENGEETNAVAELQEELEILPTIQAAGEWNVDSEWHWIYNDFEPAANKQTASYKVTIDAGDYKFKMINNSNWLGNGANITRAANSATLTANGDDMVLKADVSGEYTFTWTYETNTLVVTFPMVEPELSWNGVDGNNRAWAYMQGKEFTLPTLNNPHDVDVTYSCEDGAGIITINEETGAITLVSEGAVHITATSAATSVYLAGTATYTLYVCGVTMLTIGGDATTKEYEYGEAFERDGLTATATYNNGGGTLDVTELATWTISPETITSNGSVSVTASYASQSDQKYVYDVKVKTHAVTWTSPEHGSLTVRDDTYNPFASGTKFRKGRTCTVEAEPAAGYKLQTLTANGEDISSTKEFTIGTEDVEIVVSFVLNQPTDLDNAEAGEKAQKIMLNNQLFILRGGKIYDAQGKLVK